MNQFMHLVVIVLALSISLECKAGTIDVAISIQSDPTVGLKYGQSGNFSITLTNFGPDTAGGMSSLENPIDAIAFIEFENTGSPIHFEQNRLIEQECDFILSFAEPIPPNPLIVAYSFYFPPIPAGQSYTCHGTFFALFRSGTRTVEWQVFPGLDIDTNDANNSQEVVFGVQPVPVALNRYTTIVIFTLMILLGWLFYLRANQ